MKLPPEPQPAKSYAELLADRPAPLAIMLLPRLMRETPPPKSILKATTTGATDES